MITIDRKNFLDALAYAKVSGRVLDLMITPSINYKAGVLNLQSPILKELLEVIVNVTHVDAEEIDIFNFRYIEKHTPEGNLSTILLVGLECRLDIVIDFEAIDDVLEVTKVSFEDVRENPFDYTMCALFEETFDKLSGLSAETRHEIINNSIQVLEKII